jgi:hypothetical protein
MNYDVHYVYSASVILASAFLVVIFGLVPYGLVYPAGLQSRYSPIERH